jgi:uncharacterized protein YjiS (DUF1127 family)
MANFYDHTAVSEDAHGSRPVAFSASIKNAAPTAQYALSLIPRVTGKLRTWRRRARQRAELAQMSQAELHDIGLSSSEQRAEIGKPFWRK